MATGRSSPCSDRAGFTLVELMMAVAIIAMGAAAVVMVVPDPRPPVGAEAERFAARLISARDEAVLTNRSVAVEATASGYGFEVYDGGLWTALREGPFKPVSWEVGTSVMTVSGVSGQDAGRLVFDPTGVTDPLRLTLRREGRDRTVIVDGAGEVRLDD